MDDAFDIRPAEIDRAVDHHAGIDRLVFRFADQIAVEIDLEDVRRGNLVEHQPHRVDQHVLGLARHPRRIMREDQVVPAEMRDEAIAGGEVDPYRPFLGADMARPRGLDVERVHLWVLLVSRCAANANASVVHDDNRAGGVVQIDVINHSLRKRQIRASVRFQQSQQNDARMRPRRSFSQIGKLLVPPSQATGFRPGCPAVDRHPPCRASPGRRRSRHRGRV
jgi:hypothetical protein